MDNSANFGKKVFFLYPHSVIQEDLVEHIVQNEFEVYLVSNHTRLPSILKKFPHSILFINIDTRLKEEEWEEYVRKIMNDPATKDVQIGILTYNEDKELAKKYLMDIMVPGGYIQLKLGLKESTKIILKTLIANEARGKRRFVRAVCPKNSVNEFNVGIHEKMYTGYIKDISSAGMACYFYDTVDFQPKTVLERMQLKLKRRIVMVNGVIAGKREDKDGMIYVVLFSSYVSADAKQKLTSFVHKTLQTEMNRLLGEPDTH